MPNQSAVGNQRPNRVDRHIVGSPTDARVSPTCVDAQVLISAAADELRRSEQPWLDEHLEA